MLPDDGIHSRRLFLGGLAAASSAGSLHAADEPYWLTIDQAAALIRAKKASPVDLTKACLARIDKLNPSLDAFITVMAEPALAQAKLLEAEAQKGKIRGPLHGIPIGLKDLYDTAGVKTTAASEQFANRIPAEDAEVVRLLKAAGAIIIGKLNMDEFAYNFTAETSFYGPSRNPWDKRLSPGGSSGGSGVAVAAGLCFAALGSDTGGSIRLPASFCGIAGYKPSYGKISLRGVLPLSWTLDHAGPMTRSARGCELMFRAMGGASDPSAFRKSPRIGVPRKPFYNQLDPEVERAMTEALRVLSSSPKDVPFPTIQPSPEVPELYRPYLRVINAEAYAFHEQMLKQHPERYNALTRQNIGNGAPVTAADYIVSRRELERLREQSGTLFPDVDLLVTPTAPGPPFELGKPASLVYLRNTAPWNLFGLPTISIPCGFTKKGLPIGMQLTGRIGEDGLVLATAARYQQTTNWHSKHPPV